MSGVNTVVISRTEFCTCIKAEALLAPPPLPGEGNPLLEPFPCGNPGTGGAPEEGEQKEGAMQVAKLLGPMFVWELCFARCCSSDTVNFNSRRCAGDSWDVMLHIKKYEGH